MADSTHSNHHLFADATWGIVTAQLSKAFVSLHLPKKGSRTTEELTRPETEVARNRAPLRDQGGALGLPPCARFPWRACPPVRHRCFMSSSRECHELMSMRIPASDQPASLLACFSKCAAHLFAYEPNDPAVPSSDNVELPPQAPPQQKNNNNYRVPFHGASMGAFQVKKRGHEICRVPVYPSSFGRFALSCNTFLVVMIPERYNVQVEESDSTAMPLERLPFHQGLAKGFRTVSPLW